MATTAVVSTWYEKLFLGGRTLMRLREHPKIQCRRGGRSEVKARLEDKILKEVDFIEPSKLLLSNEMDGEIYSAELYCFNTAFACRLHEKFMPMLGRPIREVGELDLQD
jgi:hypothetical protein